jgi:hypothetical protein
MIVPIHGLECFSPEEISITFKPTLSFFHTAHLQCTKFKKERKRKNQKILKCNEKKIRRKIFC